MFLVMLSVKGSLVKIFISLTTWMAYVVFCLPEVFLKKILKNLSAF